VVNREELWEIVDELRRVGTDTATVEAKAARKALPKDLWRTISSFSNTPGRGGGLIILGLDEDTDFSIVGVDEPKKTQATLDGLLAETMEPPIRASIEIIDVDEKQLVVAEIPEASFRDKPVYNKNKGLPRGACIRSGDSNRDLNDFEIQMMLASRGTPDDDRQPVPGSSISDLDDGLRRGFLERIRRKRNFDGDSDEAVLENVRVLVRDEDDLVVSVAGMLALGKDPSRFFERLSITYVEYPSTVAGEDPGGVRFEDSIEIGDLPIPKAVDAVLARLGRTLKKKAVISGGLRQDIWEFPETAIREALVNALGHRTYHPLSASSPVQIELYPDRLTMRNPGGLFGPISEEDLGEPGVSADRNPTLMRILEDTPLGSGVVCENRGSGLPAMIASLRKAQMSPPEFRDRVRSFEVTFPNHSLFPPAIIEWLEKVDVDDLSEDQRVGLALMKQGHDMTNRLYRQATGVDSRQATKDLVALAALPYVEADGLNKGRVYRIIDAEAEAAAVTVGGNGVDTELLSTRRDRRQEVLDAFGEGEYSRADLESQTGLNRRTLLYWLRILRKEGHVEATTKDLQNPGTRYRRVQS
jgi:ATP-dependent DNA helicase RecG